MQKGEGGITEEIIFVSTWSVDNLIWNSSCRSVYQCVTRHCDIKVHSARRISLIFYFVNMRRRKLSFCCKVWNWQKNASIICSEKFLLDLLFQFVEVAWLGFCIIHYECSSKGRTDFNSNTNVLMLCCCADLVSNNWVVCGWLGPIIIYLDSCGFASTTKQKPNSFALWATEYCCKRTVV